MKILYSHRTKSTDGQYVHIDAMTRALCDLGHEVFMCGPEGTGTPMELARRLSTDHGRMAKRSLVSRLPKAAYEIAELGYNIPAAKQIFSAAARFNPDLIYERYTLFHHVGAWAAKRLGVPRLLEVNAPLADERRKTNQLSLYGLGKLSERRIWQSADRVLPVTAVLGEMLTDAGVEPAKIEVVPNGVDDRTLTLADPAPVRERYHLGHSVVLGFVGFVRDWHGVDRVLDWMSTDQGADTTLLLVGDGPATADLTAQAEQLGLKGRFHVTGVVQREEVAAHIAAFDIALQPAVTPYASPLKLQEYMAQGRAIIAPDQPNICETVTHGKDAVLIDPDAPSSLPRALTELTKDQALRHRLGDAARQTLLDKDMTWAANAARVTAMAQALITPP